MTPEVIVCKQGEGKMTSGKGFFFVTHEEGHALWLGKGKFHITEGSRTGRTKKLSIPYLPL